MSKKVLVVDDDPDALEVYKLELEGHGISVVTATDGLNALDVLAESSEIGLLVTDIQMPSMNGLDLLRTSRSLYPHIPVILCSGFAESVANWPFIYEVLEVFSKPVEFDRLTTLVKAGLGK